jgi:hypothetical protein
LEARGESDQMSVRMLGKAVFGMVIAPFSGLTPQGWLTKNEQISSIEKILETFDPETCHFNDLVLRVLDVCLVKL